MSRDTGQKRRDNAATVDATKRDSDATARQSDATPGALVASIGDAAKALGVSVRTVQRRIERGQMSVIERDGRRFVELPTGTPTDATPGATVTRQGTTVDATPRQIDATERDTEAERIAEMKAEIAFLRNVVEGQQRDAVELRQSLKRALDLAPRQLTTGTPTDAPESPPTGAACTNSHSAPNGAQKPTEARKSAPITYDSIADMIERSMGK